jgi:transposase
MKKNSSNHSRKASQGRGERVSTKTSVCTQPIYEVIKLAIDVHADFYMVVRQIDNATGQPAQKMSPEQFLQFAARQLTLARQVYSCYEAGCFGYGLHRQLEAMGIQNVVVRPQDWDELNKKVKTDRTDAHAMGVRLDRYVAGNKNALAAVRVPSLEEELSRSRARQREQFKKEKNRWGARGRSLLLEYGIRIGGKWWHDLAYTKVVTRVKAYFCENVSEPLLRMLEDIRKVVMEMERKLLELTAELEQAAEARQLQRVKGMGPLSSQKLKSEICDWDRFKNRRQVASYTGLCPGVSGSGGDFRDLSISKHGNPRLREALVELAWLMVLHQPTYPPVQRWKEVLYSKHRSGKKKAIVAIARRLAIDLWRMETGRASAQKLGVTLKDAAA